MIGILMVCSGATYAAEPCTAGNDCITNPIKSRDFTAILNALIAFIWKIGMPVLIVLFAWVGFSFVFAQGNEKQLATAKQRLYYVVIGTVIITGSAAIATIVKSFVGSLSP